MNDDFDGYNITKSKLSKLNRKRYYATLDCDGPNQPVKLNLYLDKQERDESQIMGHYGDPTIFNAIDWIEGKKSDPNFEGKWALYGFLENNTWRITKTITYTHEYDGDGNWMRGVKKKKIKYIQGIGGETKAIKLLQNLGISFASIF